MVEAGWPGKGFSVEEATGSRSPLPGQEAPGPAGQLYHLACVPFPS